MSKLCILNMMDYFEHSADTDTLVCGAGTGIKFKSDPGIYEHCVFLLSILLDRTNLLVHPVVNHFFRYSLC